MAKKTIEDLAVLIEKGEFSGKDVWFTIPGGILFGKVISSRKYIDMLTRTVRENDSPGDANNVLSDLDRRVSRFSEQLGDEDAADEKEIVVIHATLFAGGQRWEFPVINLRIASVGAWGFGSLEDYGPL